MSPFRDVSMVIGNPFPLKQNEGKSFQGSIVLGKGFVLTPQEAERLIAKDSRNKDVIFPYLNGEDLNNDPEQKASRWVINFFDWSEEKARCYPDCFEIVENLVKPERMLQNDKGGKEKWWQFLRPRSELYETISKLDQVMVLCRVSKYLSLSICKKGMVFSEATVVLALGSYDIYAIMSSSVHEVWAWKYASTLESRLRYTASEVFETFPFPATMSNELEILGKELNKVRGKIMLAGKIGLTETQNFYHDRNLAQSNNLYEDIMCLRNVCAKLDKAVLNAYGWCDINLKHDFYELDHLPDSDRERFTINPEAKKEILKRLLILNRERHASEVTLNTAPKKKGKTSDNPAKIGLFQTNLGHPTN